MSARRAVRAFPLAASRLVTAVRRSTLSAAEPRRRFCDPGVSASRCCDRATPAPSWAERRWTATACHRGAAGREPASLRDRLHRLGGWGRSGDAKRPQWHGLHVARAARTVHPVEARSGRARSSAAHRPGRVPPALGTRPQLVQVAALKAAYPSVLSAARGADRCAMKSVLSAHWSTAPVSGSRLSTGSVMVCARACANRSAISTRNGLP